MQLFLLDRNFTGVLTAQPDAPELNCAEELGRAGGGSHKPDPSIPFVYYCLSRQRIIFFHHTLVDSSSHNLCFFYVPFFLS